MLPLVALGLLSTMFLFSRGVDTTANLPFSVRDLQDRAGEQRITRPRYRGQVASGAQLAFTARSARPDQEKSGRVYADGLSGQIDQPDGSRISFSALAGVVDQEADSINMRGDVFIQTASGYHLRTEALHTRINAVEGGSEGEVRGTGPAGTLTAGRMEFRTAPESDKMQLLFTDGVKLIYEPQNK